MMNPHEANYFAFECEPKYAYEWEVSIEGWVCAAVARSELLSGSEGMLSRADAQRRCLTTSVAEALVEYNGRISSPT